MIWRDTWAGVPGVAVIAVDGPDQGVLGALVLALRLDTLPRTVTVTDPQGRALRVHLPQDLEPFSITVRINLTVEVPK